MPRTRKRPALTVTRDDDGGLTIRDPQSDLVVSVIATHPDASGPHGLTIEVYAYAGGDILRESLPPRGNPEPIHLTITRHPVTVYYPGNRP